VPKVTVLLPCHNAARTLPAALQSLLAQDLRDFEVVAVDDGSTDETAEVLGRYAALDSRIRPLHLGHGGIVAALNAGMDMALGRYVARFDADDLCLPGRLSRQAKVLDADRGLGLVGCLVRFGGSRGAAGGYARYVDWINTLTDPEDIRLNRFVESPLAHPSVMFRARLAGRAPLYRQGAFPEDYELWLRWLEAGVRMAKVEEELLVWNDPPERLSRSDERYSVQAFYAMKSGYLARWLAARGHREVGVLGAGRVTRQRAGLLEARGARVRAWYDIDPRKVGKVVHGVPVIHRDEVPRPGELFLLSYVASHGAREDIASHLRARGYVLGEHWLPAA